MRQREPCRAVQIVALRKSEIALRRRGKQARARVEALLSAGA
jgi:hypothetical protein